MLVMFLLDSWSVCPCALCAHRGILCPFAPLVLTILCGVVLQRVHITLVYM